MNELTKKAILDAMHSGTFYVKVGGSIDDPDVQEVTLEENEENSVVRTIVRAVLLGGTGFLQHLYDNGHLSRSMENDDWEELVEEFINA